VVSVERCLIQEMKSSLASSLTSSMLVTDQRPGVKQFWHQDYRFGQLIKNEIDVLDRLTKMCQVFWYSMIYHLDFTFEVTWEVTVCLNVWAINVIPYIARLSCGQFSLHHRMSIILHNIARLSCGQFSLNHRMSIIFLIEFISFLLSM